MEPERFAIGLLVILGAFAIKSGIGLYLGIRSRGGDTLTFFLLYAGMYSLLFFIGALIWERFEGLSGFIKRLMEYGADIHVVISLLLMFLGILVLGNKALERHSDKSFLALLIPCPVCISTVIFTVGTMIFVFPDLRTYAVLSLSVGFLGLGFIVYVVLRIIETKKVISNNNLIAGVTLVISSLYTLFTLLFSEGVRNSQRIFNIATKEATSFDMPSFGMAIVVIASVAAFLSGFFRKRRIL